MNVVLHKRLQPWVISYKHTPSGLNPKQFNTTLSLQILHKQHPHFCDDQLITIFSNLLVGAKLTLSSNKQSFTKPGKAP